MNDTSKATVLVLVRIALAAVAIVGLVIVWSSLDNKTEQGLAMAVTFLVVLIAAPVPWSWLRYPYLIVYTVMVGAIGVGAGVLLAHTQPSLVGIPGPLVIIVTAEPKPTLSPSSLPPPSSKPDAAMAVFPSCLAGKASDPDGDGWGWEDNRSCVVPGGKIAVSYPYCIETSADPDGDGWGWENNQSCIVRNGKTDPRPK